MSACVFCARVDRGEFFYSPVSDDVVYFTPLNPVTLGHLLFLPREHVEHHEWKAVEAVGQAMSAASWHATYTGDYRDYNLITSSGHFATQTVPHIHIHLVPRREGDGLQLPWGLPHA